MDKEQDVIVAKSAGFCPGVKRAIDKVLELEAAGKKPIYTIGPLIHNKQVTDMLAAKQITSIDKPQDAQDKSGVLVIRAHGITPQFQQEILSCNMEVVDATCPLVKRAHDVISQYAKQGYDTVIVGDGDHAEVIGLLGYTEGRGVVVNGPEEAQKLPHFKKVNVVSQTTQKESVFYQTAQIIKEKADECQISNTICQPTKDRQKETVELAKNADLVIVVGGKHSANTARLALLCRGLAPSVLHIETEADLQPEQVLHAKKIFITAGASTPNWVIDRVANWVRQTRHTHNRFSLPAFLYNGWKLFVKYSFYTAFAAMALTYVCMKLQGVRTDWKLLWFAWLFVFGLTSVNHAAEKAPTRERKISFTLGFAACATALILSALAGWQIALLAGIFLAAGIFYPFRYMLHSKIASFPGTKDFVTAMGWAFACAWLPAYAHGVPFHKAAYLAVFYAGLLVFTRSVTLGFSSVNKDLMVGKESFYKAFGISATKWVVTFILTALTGVLAALWFMPWKPFLTGMLLIGNVYTVFIVIYYYSHVTARNIKQETLIDGQFFILWLLCYTTKLF